MATSGERVTATDLLDAGVGQNAIIGNNLAGIQQGAGGGPTRTGKNAKRLASRQDTTSLAAGQTDNPSIVAPTPAMAEAIEQRLAQDNLARPSVQSFLNVLGEKEDDELRKALIRTASPEQAGGMLHLLRRKALFDDIPETLTSRGRSIFKTGAKYKASDEQKQALLQYMAGKEGRPMRDMLCQMIKSRSVHV
jgi:hypothetical protein